MNWLGWQIDYLLLLQNFRELTGHIFDSFFLVITMFGEVYIPLVTIAFLYWCLNKKIGVYMLWCYIFGFLSNTFIKTTTCIYRPWMLDGRVKPLAAAIPAATGYSFPSGHTASCTAVYGSLIVWLRKNKIIRYLSFLIILLVMFSRNYLGVHTPQDVIVSFIIGIIILYANKKLLDWENKTKNADVIITAVITLVSVLLILYVNYKSYPMDYSGGKLLYNPAPIKTEIFARIGFVYGVFYGWLIEKRLVGFTPQSGSKLNKLLRLVVGLGCLTILLKFSELVLVDILGQRFGLFSGYFIIGLFITFFYPFLCKHVYSR